MQYAYKCQVSSASMAASYNGLYLLVRFAEGAWESRRSVSKIFRRFAAPAACAPQMRREGSY